MPDETEVNDTRLEALERRLQRLDDERAVQRVVIDYGPAADAWPGDACRSAVVGGRSVRPGRQG
jgi:hypothetical protein